MRAHFFELALAVLGSALLAALAFWAYEPAVPWVYPGIRELLFERYTAAAVPGDPASMHLRGAAVLAAAIAIVAATLLLQPRYRGRAFLGGTVAGLYLTQPFLAPWVLQGDWRAALLPSLLFFAASALLLRCARSFPALAPPSAGLLLFLGIPLGVELAAQVTLRSNPPLYVLERSLEQPDSPLAQLALGMQLLSLGDPGGASAELRRAGELLLASPLAAQDEQVLALAERLAQSREDTQTVTPPGRDATARETARP